MTCSSFIEYGLERPLPAGQRPELELKCAHWINLKSENIVPKSNKQIITYKKTETGLASLDIRAHQKRSNCTENRRKDIFYSLI